jgi:hypothetical protein
MLNCQFQTRLLAESVDVGRTSHSFDAPRAESLAMMSIGRLVRSSNFRAASFYVQIDSVFKMRLNLSI